MSKRWHLYRHPTEPMGLSKFDEQLFRTFNGTAWVCIAAGSLEACQAAARLLRP